MNMLTKIYALFNKETKQFASWILDITTIPEEIRRSLLLKEIILEEYDIIDGSFDPARYRWVGDFDQGRFQDVLVDNVAVVTEKQLITKYAEIFLRKYPLNEIWEVIRDAKMITEQGIEMQDYLNNILKRLDDDILFYKTSGVHEYISRENFIEKQDNAFKTTS
jgi:hypothetical protein